MATKRQREADRKLIERCRAIVEATRSERVAMTGFLDIFHPELTDEQKRELVKDVPR